MFRFTRKRLVLALAGAAVTATVALAALPASANAVYDGRSPGSVSGCGSNYHIGTFANNRITAFNSLAPNGGSWEDYGWLEWRQSWTGTCKGYQWPRLHIEHSIYIWGGGWLFLNEQHSSPSFVSIYPQIRPQEVNVSVSGGMWQTTASVLHPGVYDGGLIYSPNTKACSSVVSYALVSSWDFYTYAHISGSLCA